jgi:hypothetical protein
MAENKLARLDLFSHERAQTVFSAYHSIPQKFLICLHFISADRRDLFEVRKTWIALFRNIVGNTSSAACFLRQIG